MLSQAITIVPSPEKQEILDSLITPPRLPLMNLTESTIDIKSVPRGDAAEVQECNMKTTGSSGSGNNNHA